MGCAFLAIDLRRVVGVVLVNGIFLIDCCGNVSISDLRDGEVVEEDVSGALLSREVEVFKHRLERSSLSLLLSKLNLKQLFGVSDFLFVDVVLQQIYLNGRRNLLLNDIGHLELPHPRVSEDFPNPSH